MGGAMYPFFRGMILLSSDRSAMTVSSGKRRSLKSDRVYCPILAALAVLAARLKAHPCGPTFDAKLVIAQLAADRPMLDEDARS